MPSIGGYRPGAGRKPAYIERKRADVAFAVLEHINATDKDEVARWVEFLDSPEHGYDALKYLKECVDGKPLQRAETADLSDNRLKFVVEFIGGPPELDATSGYRASLRSQNTLPAQTGPIVEVMGEQGEQ